MSLHPLDVDDDVALWQGNALAALTDLASLAIDSDDPQTVARVLHALDGIKDRLVGGKGRSGHIDEVEAHLLACLDGRALSDVTVGRVRFKRSYSKPRKAWRWDELLRSIVAKAPERALFNRTTGEAEAPEQTAARLISQCIGFSAGKVTGIRGLGLEPDEFCETGTTVVSVTREVAPVDESEPW